MGKKKKKQNYNHVRKVKREASKNKVTIEFKKISEKKDRSVKISAKNKKISKWHLFSFLSLILSLFFIYVCYSVYINIFKDLPSVLDLIKTDFKVTTRILDRNNKLLFSVYKDENRTPVSLNHISPHLVNATIAIEDKNFYEHKGFALLGILRALNVNIKGESLQGGSTLTQQLVKNRLLTPERTLKRKVKELILAILTERTYEKNVILEMYLNQVAYGGPVYGIEEASLYYFGKSAKNLNLSEASLLAGIPAAPSIYSPFSNNLELTYNRRNEVLRRMVEDGYITQKESDQAKAQKLTFRKNNTHIKAPHFVMYVRQLLAERYGEDILYHGGLEVKTSLDLNLHEAAQEIVSAEIDSLKKLRVNNGASLITNPQTGEILSMVGSKNYFDFENDGQVNVTIRERQPGSSIKPLTYALAFESGHNPSVIIDDAPVVYSFRGAKPYVPKNYDNSFHGKVTLRQALACSYNIPAVKLLDQIGVDHYIDRAVEMGLENWDLERNRYGLSLTLGGGEVKMTDMAELYSIFPNLGNRVDLNPFLEIKNFKGETLYRNDCVLDGRDCQKDKVLSPLAAYYVTDILSDNQARTPAFGARSVLHIPSQQVAVKTGTTNNLRDNWTIGYTTDRLVLVWVGNNDNQTMSYIASGVTGASPIWQKTMRLTLDKENPHQFAMPENLIKVKVCADQQTLPCDSCENIREEVFVAGSEPKNHCSDETEIQKINIVEKSNKISQSQTIIP